MKKFRKIMAILVAAVMIVAMAVPAWAAHSATAKNGTYGTGLTGTGDVIVANAKSGETYTAYQLFELVSFNDDDIATGYHDINTEQYSYAIAEKVQIENPDFDANAAENETNWHYKFVSNPWYTYLTGYNENGAVSVSNPNAWAIVTDDSFVEGTTDASSYFVIEAAKVNPPELSSLTTKKDWHIIKAGRLFKSTKDTTLDDKKEDSYGADTSRSDEGVSAGINFVTHANNKLVQKFAQEALKWAKDSNNGVTAEGSKTATSNGSLTVISGAALGYWLVGSTMGTLVSLDTSNNVVTVYEKNDEPIITKQVENKDTADTWQNNVDADINDIVKFKIEITAEQGMDRYVLHDYMETGLEYFKDADHAMTVLLKRGETTYYVDASVSNANCKDLTGTAMNPKVSATNWGTEPAVGTTTFDIVFSNAAATRINDVVAFVCKATPDAAEYQYVDIQDGDKIVVTYYAKLNSSAKIYNVEDEPATTYTAVKNNKTEPLGKGVLAAYTEDLTDDQAQSVQVLTNDGDMRNDNWAVLTYGDRGYTPWVNSSVTTYQFDIVKTEDDLNGDKKYDLLAGAEFEVYKVVGTSVADEIEWTVNSNGYKNKETGRTAPLVFSQSTNDYMYVGDATTATTGDSSYVNKITSTNTGKIRLYGLESGKYLLKEVKAPTGYDILAYPIVVEVNGRSDEDNATLAKVSVDKEDEGWLKYDMENHNNKNVSETSFFDPLARIDTNATSGKQEYYTERKKTGSETVIEQGGVHIVNRTTTELPSTGGMGTTVLYIVGGMLVILAGAYLFFSRKRTA